MRLSETDETDLVFDRFGVRLGARLRRADFERWIHDDLVAIEAAMDRALMSAGVADGGIDAVFMTGGTSHVPAVRQIFERRFGPARLHAGNAFQSVASGLALIARDRALSEPVRTDCA
jgi:hypothetical chaperone protein